MSALTLSAALLPVPAHAAAANRYAESQILPLVSDRAPRVQLATDADGDAAFDGLTEFSLADQEVYGLAGSAAAGADTDLDTAYDYDRPLFVANGRAEYEILDPHDPTEYVIQVAPLAGGTPVTFNDEAAQPVGLAGNGDVIRFYGTALSMEEPGGSSTALDTSSLTPAVVADGTEVVTAVEAGDGTWSVDHLDISSATPVSKRVTTKVATEPQPFITPTTYGWYEPSTQTLHYFARGATTSAHYLSMPTGTTGNAMTDGTTAAWDTTAGLQEAPLTALTQPVALPSLAPYTASFSSRGLMFLAQDAASGEVAIDAASATGAVSTADDLGYPLDPVNAIALGQGTLVRAGEEVSTLPLSDADSPAVAGDPSEISDTAAAAYVKTDGTYTAIGNSSGGFDVVDPAGNVVFAPDGQAEALDLHNGELAYTDSADKTHVVDLASGTDGTADNGGGWLAGGGMLYAAQPSGSGLLMHVRAETPTAMDQVYVLPLSVCPSPGGIYAAFGNWIKATCDGQATAVNLATRQAYPVADPDAQLGDGILVSADTKAEPTCVAIQVVSAGETSATCVDSGDAAQAVLDPTGGEVAWLDGYDVTHVLRVLPDVPAVTPTSPTSIPIGGIWSLNVPLTQASSWRLDLTLPSGHVISAGTSAGAISATYSAPQLGSVYIGPVPWSLGIALVGGHSFTLSGTFTIAAYSPPPAPPFVSQPLPKAPNLKLSLGKVKKVHGVVQLRRGAKLTVTSAATQRSGCVKIVAQRLVGKKWVAAGTSKCLSQNKKSATVEKFAKAGKYRIEVTWSLQTRPLATYSVKVI